MMAGSTTSVQMSTLIIPTTSSAPMPAIARWLASIRFPNPTMVVRPL